MNKANSVFKQSGEEKEAKRNIELEKKVAKKLRRQYYMLNVANRIQTDLRDL